MKTKIDWHAYRITALLYIGILILPLSFYFTFDALKGVESSGETIRLLGRSGGEMLTLPMKENPSERERTVRHIDAMMQKLSLWFDQNDDTTFYVGEQTPKKDFESLKKCWEDLRAHIDRNRSMICWQKARGLSLAVERMSSLRMDRVRNILYLTLAFAVLLLLFLIFFVRTYIRQQLIKQALRDPETGLLNQNYCETSLQKHCARAKRYKHPLSTLLIKLPSLEKMERQSREKLLADTGSYLQKVVRTSDIACRYDMRVLVLILPDTPEEGAHVLANRIEKELTEKIRKNDPHFSFTWEVRSLGDTEECDAFLRRAVR
jgi:diguanylate cyclase (GGDEF)-like protein